MKPKCLICGDETPMPVMGCTLCPACFESAGEAMRTLRTELDEAVELLRVADNWIGRDHPIRDRLDDFLKSHP